MGLFGAADVTMFMLFALLFDAYQDRAESYTSKGDVILLVYLIYVLTGVASFIGGVFL